MSFFSYSLCEKLKNSEIGILYYIVITNNNIRKLKKARIMELNELRNEIRNIDCELMKLMKKRLEVAKQIGLEKQKNGIQIKNADVEKKVIERYVQFAKENNMDERISEEICKLLIEESVNLQNNL